MPLIKNTRTQEIEIEVEKENPQAELDKLTQEELELSRKLEELRSKKEYINQQAKLKNEIDKAHEIALAEHEERTKGLTITLQKVENDELFFHAPKHEVLLAQVWHRLQGRRFDWDNQQNVIPISSYETLQNQINQINQVGKLKVNLSFLNSTKEKLDSWLNRPRLEIKVSEDKKYLIFQINKGEDFLARQVTGMRYNHQTKVFRLPVGEVWNAVEKLETEPGIVWTEEAAQIAEREISARKKLDEIALKEDVELEIEDKLHAIKLRPFQRVGVKFGQATRYRYLLADQMGLGKTIQAIGCAKLLAKELGREPNVLVVCPASLVVNWAREINKVAHDPVYLLKGREPSKWDIETLFLKKYNWFILNYTILGSKTETFEEHEMADGRTIKSNIRDRYVWAEFANMSQFDLIILDEAHYIKNTSSQRSQAARTLDSPHMIAMTGTPVLNRPGELWPVLTILQPERFPSYEGFIDTYTWNGKEAKNVEKLRELLKNVMLRRTKKEVMKDLPPINRIYEWHELSDSARKQYKDIQRGLYTVLAAWNPQAAGSQQEITNILAQIQRMKQVCAIDKVSVIADMAVEISDSDTDANESGKVLIFTQYVPVAEEIGKRLGNEAITHTGSVGRYNRQDLVDQFIKDKEKKFFIATWQTAGEGLNLQIANNVIFADLFWTPANHQQCEERAYGRLADPHPINSYYLVTQDTVEEWIQEILERKLRIIEQVVEGLDTERGVNIAGELLKKMKMELRKG